MDSVRIKEQIHESAAEIVRLHSRIHATLPHRGQSPAKTGEWQQACLDFHSRYDELAFPGGYTGALERISSGEPNAMEAAICFLECRPYFFRSGYMFKDILRRCRRAPLSTEQLARLKNIEERLAEWRRKKSKRSRR